MRRVASMTDQSSYGYPIVQLYNHLTMQKRQFGSFQDLSLSITVTREAIRPLQRPLHARLHPGYM